LNGIGRQKFERTKKYTRSKNIFPDDAAALKAVYLGIKNLEKKWLQTIRSWIAILKQYIFILEVRCQN
jgi:transposase-like protein